MTVDHRPSKMGEPTDHPDAYHIITHGGLGDVLWLYRRLQVLDAPLFVHVSNENRTRPRRVGRMLDHLPRVVGWCYEPGTFAPGGQDWTQSVNDPACAINKKWSELGIRPGVPARLECNRWLEAGRRIEDWLPDLPVNHAVPWETPGTPSRNFSHPTVVLHIAGWPDVPDSTWISALRMFHNLAHIYIVGGSYDRRPRQVYQAADRPKGVTLLEDVTWEDLYGVLKTCDYCIGHASGFTAIADTLGVKGVTFNPRSVQYLIGTWNDPDNTAMLHVDRVAAFERAIAAAHAELAKTPSASWPPSLGRGVDIRADTTFRSPAAAAVHAAALAVCPRQIAFLFDALPDDHAIGSAALEGVLDAGETVQAVTLAGADEHIVAALYGTSARSSKRPVIDASGDRTALLGCPITYNLTVVVTDNSRRQAIESVAWAWAHTAAGGTLLVGGAKGADAVTALANSKRIVHADVAGAPGWYYMHRKM